MGTAQASPRSVLTGPHQANASTAKGRHSTVDKFLSTKLSQVQRAALVKGAKINLETGDLLSKASHQHWRTHYRAS